MGKKKDPGAALRAEAQANMAKAVEEIKQIDMPDYMKQQAYINLMAEQVPELAGTLDPVEVGLPVDIQADPKFMEAQMAALESMSERGKAGLSGEDKLKYEDARMAMAADAKAQQADLARRNAEMGGGSQGSRLAQQIAAQQGSAQRASEFGRGMAADALQAKMQSEQAAGQMAGQMSQQDIARQQANQQAQMQIAQFNAANRMNVNQQNLAAKQNLANQRAALQQQKYGQLGGLEQQKFSNQMAKAGAISGAYTGQANMLAQQAGQMAGGPSKGGAALSGAAQGAATGTAIGGPGWGTAIGAGVGALGGFLSAKDGAVVHAENGLASAGSFDPYARARQAREGRTMGGDLNVFKSQVKGLLGGEGLPTKEDPYGFESQIAAQSIKGSLLQPTPDARSTGANMPQGPAPAQEAADQKAKGVASGLSALSSMFGGAEKQVAAQPWKNIEAPQITLPQDRVFGAPFADGGVPGYRAADGTNVSVDGGFIFDGEDDEYAGDRVDAKVNRGEMILNAEQQQRLLELLRGNMSPEEALNTGEDIIEEPEQEEARGLMKVLEMIGRK